MLMLVKTIPILVLCLAIIACNSTNISATKDQDKLPSTEIKKNSDEVKFIRCTLFYRPTILGDEELAEDAPPLKDKSITKIIKLNKDHRSERNVLGGFIVNLIYSNDKNDCCSFQVSVHNRKTGKILSNALYQFGSFSEIRNNFTGEHGFTGLNYVYLQNSDSELQWMCAIEDTIQ
jgi:hypothetical protein